MRGSGHRRRRRRYRATANRRVNSVGQLAPSVPVHQGRREQAQELGQAIDREQRRVFDAAGEFAPRGHRLVDV